MTAQEIREARQIIKEMVHTGQIDIDDDYDKYAFDALRILVSIAERVLEVMEMPKENSRATSNLASYESEYDEGYNAALEKVKELLSK